MGWLALGLRHRHSLISRQSYIFFSPTEVGKSQTPYFHRLNASLGNCTRPAIEKNQLKFVRGGMVSCVMYGTIVQQSTTSTSGHFLAVALWCGRNIWANITVLRNSRREAGCAQRNIAILGAQLFSPQRRKKSCAFFITCGGKKKYFSFSSIAVGGIFVTWFQDVHSRIYRNFFHNRRRTSN